MTAVKGQEQGQMDKRLGSDERTTGSAAGAGTGAGPGQRHYFGIMCGSSRMSSSARDAGKHS